MSELLRTVRFLGLSSMLLACAFVHVAESSVLLGVTGDGGDPGETLFTLDQSDASAQ